MSPAGMTPFLCPKEAGADHEVALIEEVGRIPDKADGGRCTLNTVGSDAGLLHWTSLPLTPRMVQTQLLFRPPPPSRPDVGTCHLSVQGMVSLRVRYGVLEGPGYGVLEGPVRCP